MGEVIAIKLGLNFDSDKLPQCPVSLGDAVISAFCSRVEQLYILNQVNQLAASAVDRNEFLNFFEIPLNSTKTTLYQELRSH
jgi:hypothetical protein